MEKEKNILIVEDDKFISEMYNTKFCSQGFCVQLAHDGLEALEILKDNKPNLILLDIMMPGMNGMELLKKIKSDKRLKDIHVIMLTNANERDHIEEALRIGASDYLIKSKHTPEEILEEVKKRIF